jgi:hypothetical protein
MQHSWSSRKKYLTEGNDVYAQMGGAGGPMAGSCEYGHVPYRVHKKLNSVT